METLSKLLLIEDDRGIALALQQALANNYQVEVAQTGKQGLYKSDNYDYTAIILDLNLPDLSGLDICQQLRERGVEAPILVLTAETEVLTKINLLDAGAHDYLTKPFSLGELKARLRGLIRRAGRPLVDNRLQVGDLSLSATSLEVIRQGQCIILRRKEFALLECLMLNAGMVVSREALARYAWQGSDTTWTNTIDVHIKYLRDKIDKPFDGQLIKTIHGVGYRLAIETTPCLIPSPNRSVPSRKDLAR